MKNNTVPVTTRFFITADRLLQAARFEFHYFGGTAATDRQRFVIVRQTFLRSLRAQIIGTCDKNVANKTIQTSKFVRHDEHATKTSNVTRNARIPCRNSVRDERNAQRDSYLNVTVLFF